MRPVRARSTAADVRERLATQVLVCDGAMGTMLHAGGVSLDRCLPELNASHADLVRSIHRAYLAAGASVIETNTFGASRVRLARYGLSGRTTELNRAGVRLAREAQEQAGQAAVLVAGSVSAVTPGGLTHRLPVRELREAFREQIEALFEGGVDLLVFETFGSLAELVEAVGVAASLGPVPIVAQMTFVEDGRALGGDSPEEVATTLTNLGVAVVGANCTLGPQGLLDVLTELARWTNLPLAAQPNAGPPTLNDGRFQYTSAEPGYFARHARRFVELGATLVGGCCGTTPAHIEAVAAVVAGMSPALARRLPGTGRLVRDMRPRAPEQRQPEAEAPDLLFDRAGQGEFVLACELPPRVGAEAGRAVPDAAMLQAAGCQAVIVGPVDTTRAHVSPASIALLVQQRVPDLEVILTATTWEKSLMVLQADLLGTYAFGIRHVLCRTGTPPLHGDYPNAAGVWEVDSLGLIEVLRGLNEGRDYNGIPVGRPTSFVIGARVNPAAHDFAHEVAVARRKLATGASFLVTPPVYDLDALERLLEAIGPAASLRRGRGPQAETLGLGDTGQSNGSPGDRRPVSTGQEYGDPGDRRPVGSGHDSRWRADQRPVDARPDFGGPPGGQWPRIAGHARPSPNGVPVLLGLLPLQDLRHAEYLQHEVPEMAIPRQVLDRMARAGESGPAVGRDIARELARSARERGLVHGVVVSSAAGSAAELANLLPTLIH